MLEQLIISVPGNPLIWLIVQQDCLALCIILNMIVSYVVRLHSPAQWGFVRDHRVLISHTSQYRAAQCLLINRSKSTDDRAWGRTDFLLLSCLFNLEATNLMTSQGVNSQADAFDCFEVNKKLEYWIFLAPHTTDWQSLWWNQIGDCIEYSETTARSKPKPISKNKKYFSTRC